MKRTEAIKRMFAGLAGLAGALTVKPAKPTKAETALRAMEDTLADAERNAGRPRQDRS